MKRRSFMAALAGIIPFSFMKPTEPDAKSSTREDDHRDPDYYDYYNTARIGKPMRFFDGLGNEVLIPVAANTRTGWVRCNVVLKGKMILTVDGGDIAKIEQYVPLPIRMIPYRKEEDALLAERNTPFYYGYEKINDWNWSDPPPHW